MNRLIGKTTFSIVILIATLTSCQLPVFDFHTQYFADGSEIAGNLEGKQLYFQPASSISFYGRLVSDFDTMPFDTTNHTVVDFGLDGDPVQLDLPAGTTVMYYDQAYSRLYVGSNGTVAFGAPGTGNGDLVQHFSSKQISLLPLDARTSGRVTYQIASNAITITFENVEGSTVQGEFFVDGPQQHDIALTYPEIGLAVGGVVGFSYGQLAGATDQEIDYFLNDEFEYGSDLGYSNTGSHGSFTGQKTHFRGANSTR